MSLVWSIAGVGVALKASDRLSQPWLSNGMYLVLGWLVILAAVPLLQNVARAAMLWFVAGGLAYSVGIIFFVLDHRIPYFHTVWHGFTAAGSICHTIALMEH